MSAGARGHVRLAPLFQRRGERAGDCAICSTRTVVALVRGRRLAGRGILWVDAHLLASALASSAALWSVDAPLTSAAGELCVRFAAATARPGVPRLVG